jgi:hypothetical protein
LGCAEFVSANWQMKAKSPVWSSQAGKAGFLVPMPFGSLGTRSQEEFLCSNLVILVEEEFV